MTSPVRKVRWQVASWRRPKATWLVILSVLIIGGLAAQGPYHYWTVLHDFNEDLVVRQEINGNLTFRIGWGECLFIRADQWQVFVDKIPSDRYMNVRDYADSVWTQNDDYPGFSCPYAPLEVKPYWRGSRPTYVHEYDRDTKLWVRGPKTRYRIATSATVPCEPYNANKPDGTLSNYWRLPENTEVYIGDETFIIANIPLQLVTICRAQDVSIEDYRG